eukprot:10772131-Alexandrium_andersonii.AAC.1
MALRGVEQKRTWVGKGQPGANDGLGLDELGWAHMERNPLRWSGAPRARMECHGMDQAGGSNVVERKTIGRTGAAQNWIRMEAHGTEQNNSTWVALP